MEAKEKANDLIQRYLIPLYDQDTTAAQDLALAKQCALIAVDELIKQEREFHCDNPREYYYWEEVRTELEAITTDL